jgi:hypothetical protein
MVRLRIKSIESADVDVDVWKPESPEDVYFPLELEIGLAGEEADYVESEWPKQ